MFSDRFLKTDDNAYNGHSGLPERHEEEPVAETVVTVIFSDLKQFVADVLSDTLEADVWLLPLTIPRL